MAAAKPLDDGRFSAELRQWREHGQYIELDGQHYFYRDLGQRPALLMVHGFPTSSWDWHKIAQALAQDYRVLAPDMLGFGFSDKPEGGDYSTAAHARFHERFLAALGIREVHVLTYSCGASVVQQMLLNNLQAQPHQAPLNIATVTFLNGGLFAASNKPKLSQHLLLSPLGPLLARLMRRSSLERNLRAIFGPATQPDAQLISDYWELLKLNGGRERLPQLIGYLRDRARFALPWQQALVDHPARKQLVIGLQDSISGRLIAEDYRELMPDPLIRALPDIGHYPQLEAPQMVIEAVRALAR